MAYIRAAMPAYRSMIRVAAGINPDGGKMMPAPVDVPFGISLGGSVLLGALIGSGGRAGICADEPAAVPQQSVVVAQPSQQSPRRNQLRKRASSPPPPQSSWQPQSACAGAGAG